MTRFETCLPFTLIQECPLPSDWSNPRNFSNDKHDPGGKTMCGIIQREYDLWRKGHGLPTQDVRLMTREEGEAIYQIGYWLPHCDNLTPGMDLQFFDTSVNMGTTEATRILQVVLGLNGDGAWGPLTNAAVALLVKDTSEKIRAFTNRREAVYRSFGSFQYFGTDWIRRSQEIGAEALKMAGA